MSAELKAKLIEHLEMPHSYLLLKCGEDEISLYNLRGKNPMQRIIGIYVNGAIEGKWSSQDCTDHEVQYLRKIKKPVWTKQELKHLKMKVNKYIEYNLPAFPSAKMAINHLFKVCPDLTVLRDF